MSELLVKVAVTINRVTKVIHVDGDTDATLVDLAEHALEERAIDLGLGGAVGDNYDIDLLDISVGTGRFIIRFKGIQLISIG